MNNLSPGQIAELIDRHGSALCLYARQFCSTPEDVVQEAFVKLVRQRKAPQNPKPWLFRVVRNMAISTSRSEQRRRSYETRASEALEPFCSLVAPPHGSMDPAAAEAALASLDPALREVVVARLWGDLSFEEIASVVKCSSSTAHRHYVQAIEILRSHLCQPTNTRIPMQS